MQDPPVKTVRKFLHLLEHSDADFEEELGIYQKCLAYSQRPAV